MNYIFNNFRNDTPRTRAFMIAALIFLIIGFVALVTNQPIYVIVCALGAATVLAAGAHHSRRK
jgi:uncharacterized membrane protein YccC